MSGIFRKVMCSDRLPKVENENYFTISEKGHEKIRFFNGTRFESAYYEGEVKWWLEEIELPSEENKQAIVKEWYKDQQFKSNYPAQPSSFMAGFNKAVEIIKGV